MHNKLSIQDLTNNSNQPMSSSNGRFILIYNGEIYNKVDLANTIKVESVSPIFKSDTKLLLETTFKS